MSVEYLVAVLGGSLFACMGWLVLFGLECSRHHKCG
jgi:hypothetical protein